MDHVTILSYTLAVGKSQTGLLCSVASPSRTHIQLLLLCSWDLQRQLLQPHFGLHQQHRACPRPRARTGSSPLWRNKCRSDRRRGRGSQRSRRCSRSPGGGHLEPKEEGTLATRKSNPCCACNPGTCPLSHNHALCAILSVTSTRLYILVLPNT